MAHAVALERDEEVVLANALEISRVDRHGVGTRKVLDVLWQIPHAEHGLPIEVALGGIGDARHGRLQTVDVGDRHACTRGCPTPRPLPVNLMCAWPPLIRALEKG